MALFRLTLQKTCYRQGFFNVTVDFDRFIAAGQHGPVAPHGGRTGGQQLMLPLRGAGSPTVTRR